MKYKVGDRLLIKSKIISSNDDGIKVSTSCSNGYDTFILDKCKNMIEGEHIIHEVVVTGFDTWKDGRVAYHTKNDLSVTKCGWQGVSDCDIIRKITDERLFDKIVKFKNKLLMLLFDK